MVVGKVYTPRQLGLYTRAEQFSLMIALNFTLVLQRVSLPALTNSKSSQASFDSAFQWLYKFSALLGSLFLFSLAAMADNFTYVLVGHQWMDSAPILRILSIYAAFPPIIALHQNILQVFGKSRLFLSLEAIKTLISTIIVAATIFLSFYALLWGVVFIGIISLAINGYWGSKYLSTYTQSKQLRDTLVYFLISAVVALLVYFSSFLLTSHACKLGIQLLVFVVSSLLLFVFILKDERRALTQILRPSSKTQINNE